MASRRKSDVVTFKADPSLLLALRGVPNRSAFIRAALLTALQNTCPLCCGTGQLTPDQRNHWNALATDHHVEECDDCHAVHLVCNRRGKRIPHRKRT